MCPLREEDDADDNDGGEEDAEQTNKQTNMTRDRRLAAYKEEDKV